jgi:cyclohexadienyl dehydratase
MLSRRMGFLLRCVASACRVALAAWAATAAGAEPVRVGASGDYAPFSVAVGDAGYEVRGFDAAVARAWAAERGVALHFVRFRWSRLVDDLVADRFDVAMSGVTVRPERSVAGRFGVPVVETGAVALVREPERWTSLDSLDAAGVRIAVNAGGHLERVARGRFPRAALVALPENAGVLRALQGGRVDAAVSDTLEAPRWRAAAPQLGTLGPFTRDRKAYLVRAGRPELAADLDAWLLEAERDGRLARLRREHLGSAGDPVATPLSAVVAAVDERLSLMPLVAAAKRSAGLGVEAPERERRVEDAALGAVRRAARLSRRRPPSEEALRAFYRAQIEAAKEVQRAWRPDPTQVEPGRAHEPAFDLDGELRPALLRIGDRIAALLLRLPPGLEEETVRWAVDDGIRSVTLSHGSRAAIASTLQQLASQPGDSP